MGNSKGRAAKHRGWILAFFTCLLVSVRLMGGQTAGVVPTQSSSSASPATPLAVTDMPGRNDLILRHLNVVITWYRNIGNQLPTVGLPTDAIYQNNARMLAVQVVQAAFQSATADALLISQANKTLTADAAPDATQDGTLDVSKMGPQLEAQITQAKAQLATVAQQLATASSGSAPVLEEQRARLQGNLEMLTAEDAAVEQLAKFSLNSSSSNTQLQQSIAQLQRNVPEANTPAATSAVNGGKPAAPAAAVATQLPATQESTGLISEAGALFSQANSLHKIDVLNQQAQNAEDLAKQLRTPLMTQIHQTVGLAASWAAAPGTAGAPAVVAATNVKLTKQQFDALTAQFKRLSAVALPLSQEVIDLDESRSNLTQWRQSLGQENSALLRKVLTKVGVIAVSLGLLSFLSFLSNRLIFRYVQDVRRRRQVLILRRFIVGFLMGIVLIMGFVSEFSSLATFAGFITAGIAVGLQTILLSVAAYFFLIGRYGIRVGDRISIAGTTGDVIDVGLIRLYMMELAGTGNDLFPTGRIVVFPNSVLFQATVPLFKQIPGTDYAWHEIAATLNPGVDARVAQEKMLAAVQSVHETYRADFERQHSASSRVLDVRIEVPAPSAHLQFATAGLESVVRYPVSLRSVVKADEEVTEKVLAALNGSVDFKSAVTGMPTIRVAVKG